MSSVRSRYFDLATFCCGKCLGHFQREGAHDISVIGDFYRHSSCQTFPAVFKTAWGKNAEAVRQRMSDLFFKVYGVALVGILFVCGGAVAVCVVAEGRGPEDEVRSAV